MLPLTTSFTEERRKIGEKIQLGTHPILAIVKTVEKKEKRKQRKKRGLGSMQEPPVVKMSPPSITQKECYKLF